MPQRWTWTAAAALGVLGAVLGAVTIGALTLWNGI